MKFEDLWAPPAPQVVCEALVCIAILLLALITYCRDRCPLPNDVLLSSVLGRPVEEEDPYLWREDE